MRLLIFFLKGSTQRIPTSSNKECLRKDRSKSTFILDDKKIIH